MSIKSDRWIRQMAETHGMIEPFEPHQVRYNAQGQSWSATAPQAMAMMYAAPMNLRYLPMYILPSLIPKTSMSAVLLISSVMSVSFHRTHLPWRGRLSTFVFQEMC